jgi:holliday junction DNA helicase RuvA
MFYLRGQIKEIFSKTIIFECSYQGFLIRIARTKELDLKKHNYIYIYENNVINSSRNEMLKEYYGFISYKERDLFIKLLAVPGIGTKTAINILENNFEELTKSIKNNDIETLVTKFKIRRNIALSICDSLSNFNKEVLSKPIIKNSILTLRRMGYKNDSIDKAINQIKDVDKIQDEEILIKQIIENIVKV